MRCFHGIQTRLVRAADRAARRIGCFFAGHDWRVKSAFSGGALYECKRCDRGYTSFFACPSYRIPNDHWFDYLSTRTLGDRIRGRRRRRPMNLGTC